MLGTFFIRQLVPSDAFAHRQKSAEILSQSLIRLPLQVGQMTEPGPFVTTFGPDEKMFRQSHGSGMEKKSV
jgi:hypothetical protein